MGHEESSYICNRIFYQQYVSRRRIGRILHQCGLFSRGTRRKYRKQPSYHIYSNIVNQDFKANYKNQIWFGDITYIPTQEGMIYCSVFYCFTRKIIGYSIRSHMRETMVIKSLEMAIIKEKPKQNSLFIAIMAHNIYRVSIL